MKKEKLLILGGGISGMYLAATLKRDYNIVLVDKGFSLGGKIKTLYESSSKSPKIKYEAGPWRINGSHKRIIQLLNKHGIKIATISSDSKYTLKKYIDADNINNNCKNNDTNLPIQSSLSHSDRNIHTHGLGCQFSEDIKSGYQGNLDAHHKTYPYYSSGTYYCVPDGFRALIDKIHGELTESKVNILNNSLVIDVKKQNKKYEVVLQDGTVLRSDKIIVTIPPENWCNWTIYTHLKPISKCVDSRSLHHIYAHSKQDTVVNKKNCFHLHTSSPLSQIISSSYGNKWFQVSYSGGTVADYWFRLKLDSKKRFQDKVRSEFKKVISKGKLMYSDLDKIESHYVRHGYHIWLPKYNFNYKSILRQALQPDPMNLPGLFVAGESFSSNQGWIEGALETSDKVVKLLGSKKTIESVGTEKDLGFEYLIYKNRILKVDKWKQRHPGSKGAIMGHLGEHVEYFFDKIHTNETHGILSHLHYCWIDNKGHLWKYC